VTTTQSTPITVRQMHWWDIEPVLHLETVLFEAEAWSAAMFWSELAERDSRHYYVACRPDDADAVIGYAGLCAYGDDAAYVQTIGVDPSHQRGGIGAALLEQLIADARRLDCARVDLEVRAGNDPAIRLYEKYGFAQIGIRKRYYQPSGADAVVMSLRLGR
jgi:[ribosomal protein S18]-alanine N-acetyltransferase